MLGYSSVLALAVLCAVIYSITIKLRIRALRRMTQAEVQKERLMLESLTVEQNRVKWQTDGLLSLFPIITDYLGQSTIILNNRLQLDGLKMIKAKEEQVQQLLSEIKTAPEELRDLVIEQYNINKTLTRFKNPVRTFMEEVKIKLMFLAARIFIKLLEKIPNNCNQLKKREEQLKFEMFTLCCKAS